MQKGIEWDIKNLSHLIRRELDKRIAMVIENDEFTRMQGIIIGYIFEHSKNAIVLQKDIESEFVIRRSSVTVLLQSMEKKGLIYREDDAIDKRQKCIYLTEIGKSYNERITKVFEDFREWFVSDLTKEEEEYFVKTINKLTKKVQQGEMDSD